jgi:hypothetical protein
VSVSVSVSVGGGLNRPSSILGMPRSEYRRLLPSHSSGRIGTLPQSVIPPILLVLVTAIPRRALRPRRPARPDAGRAKLRLSRGFTVDPARAIEPDGNGDVIGRPKNRW